MTQLPVFILCIPIYSHSCGCERLFETTPSQKGQKIWVFTVMCLKPNILHSKVGFLEKKLITSVQLKAWHWGFKTLDT